jgi:hypothetical protein
MINNWNESNGVAPFKKTLSKKSLSENSEYNLSWHTESTFISLRSSKSFYPSATNTIKFFLYVVA